MPAPVNIPAEGIWGETALREASQGNYRKIMELISKQLRSTLKLAGKADVWPHVVALYPSQVVVNQDGTLMRYDYVVTGTTVTLTAPVEVIETFEPAELSAREAQGQFLEAVEKKGAGKFLIRVIRAGLSGNGNFYPDQVLREAAPMFEKVRVFIKGDAEHLAGKGKDVRNLIGRLTNPKFVEGQSSDTGEIQAVFELIEPDGSVAVKLREAYDRDMADLLGFSIDVAGRARVGKIAGKSVRVAQKFREVKSVDLIVEPGAGGQVIQLIEAQGDPDMKLREKMLKFIEAQLPAKFAELDQEDDDAIDTLYREALVAEAAGAADDNEAKDPGAGAGDAARLTEAQVDERIGASVRMVEARSYARAEINASTLPDAAKARLRERFDGETSFKEADVDTAIKEEREYLAQFAGGGSVTGLGDEVEIRMGESQFEKVGDMLDAFFDPSNTQVHSFKECYRLMTGDGRVTGMLKNCDSVRMREALASGSFTDVLGDAIARRMIADYRTADVIDMWRNIVNVVPVGDFRTQHRTRWGGYGDLPEVNESDPYTALTSPSDEEIAYAVTKRGGTEQVTLEMIKNDDMGVIQRIPTRLSRSAKRTLSKFVFDFIRTNPTMDYDGVALFHADHGNLGSTALSAASFAAGRLAMVKQTEFGTDEPIGLNPKSLLVPHDLEETAADLFRRNTENDKTFVQSLSPDIIPVWYWTDANDWALVANPLDVPTIEIGFLDNQQEPELFVQDTPNQGSMFSNDQLTWKIRHIYGGDVEDHRGFYKAVVA